MVREDDGRIFVPTQMWTDHACIVTAVVQNDKFTGWTGRCAKPGCAASDGDAPEHADRVLKAIRTAIKNQPEILLQDPEAKAVRTIMDQQRGTNAG